MTKEVQAVVLKSSLLPALTVDTKMPLVLRVGVDYNLKTALYRHDNKAFFHVSHNSLGDTLLRGKTHYSHISW